MNPFAASWLLDQDIAYLDHGAFGACPQPVLAHQTALRAQIERGPSTFFLHRLEPLIDEARSELARFLGASSRDLVFVPNATTGINAVLRGLALTAGDELLITNHGYAAVRNTAQFVAERSGARVVVAEVPFPITDSDQVAEAILAATTRHTRLAIIDHVTSATALVWPIAEIVRALDDRGVATLVDGAHAPGMVPVDLERIASAYYVGTCHKWLCSPKGAGFLWVRQDRQSDLHPTTISHGFRSFREDRSRLHLEFDWVGTGDPTPYLCTPTALRFMDGLMAGGWTAVMQTNRERALFAQRALVEALGGRAPAPDSMIGAMASIPIREARDDEYGDDFTTDPLHKVLLYHHAIDVPVLAWPQWPRRVLRASAQLYNTNDQFTRLAETLVAVGMTAGA